MKKARAYPVGVMFLALGGGLWPVAASHGQPCTQPAENCQNPDQRGHGPANVFFVISDTNPDASTSVPDMQGGPGAAQDNFVVADGGDVSSICWWGAYIDGTSDCGPGPGDSFTVTYFNNQDQFPGVPGTIKAGPFTQGVDLVVSKAATGNVIQVAAGVEFDEYEFAATHPPVAVGAGETVWIEVQNNTTGTCAWLWTTAPHAGEMIPGNGDSVSWRSDQLNDFDLAFCIDQPLNTVSPEACIGALNPCDMESGDVGCSDPACCTEVCAELPICCVNAWDANCVAAAADLCALPAGCGVPGTGDCFDNPGSTHCDDTCGGEPCEGCCELVCGVDPFCCDTSWDGICNGEAMQLCVCQPEDAPANDECVDAIPITVGTTAVTNDCATPGLPDHASCNDGFAAGLGLDVWYSFTSTFTGALAIQAAVDDGALWEVQIALYEGCDCAALEDPPLACESSPGGDIVIDDPDLLAAEVVKGTCYLIRLGGTVDGASGTGTLTLFEAPEACDPQAGDCNTAHGGVGCDNLPCCANVCAQIPECCDVAWDQACADLADQICAAAPCGPLDLSPATVQENEPCLTDLAVDTISGGCNSDPPVFVDIASGDVVHGIASTYNVNTACDVDDDCPDLNCVGDPNPGDGVAEGECDGASEPAVDSRDTDWYRLEVVAEDDVNGNGLVDIAFSIVGELPVVSFVIIDEMPVCQGETPTAGLAYGQSCTSVIEDVVTLAAPGTYYLFGGTGDAGGGGIFDGLECGGEFGNDYLLSVTVSDDAAPCPWDLDGDGTVGTPDFLDLLAQWGTDPGGPPDFDGDGTVGTTDFLELLANWGDCP